MNSPAPSDGAHQLHNTGSEALVYIDFDAIHNLDAALYPDTGNIGYYDGE